MQLTGSTADAALPTGARSAAKSMFAAASVDLGRSYAMEDDGLA